MKISLLINNYSNLYYKYYEISFQILIFPNHFSYSLYYKDFMVN